MKKLFVVAVTALLVLTGCGSKSKDTPSASEPTVLKIAGLEGGYGNEGLEAVAKAFEETKGGTVKVELTLAKNITDVLRPQIQAGDVPDVIHLSIGAEGKLTDTMIAEKNIEEISDVVTMKIPGEEVTVKDKVLPGFLESIRTQPYADGKTYLMPQNYSPLGLFYNEGLFAEKGWTVPTTWDEMFALGDKAKAEGIALFTYPTTGYFDGFFSSLLNATAGPDVYAKLMNYDEAAWKLPEVKEAFDIVGKLATYTHQDTVAQANKEGFTKNQQLILDNKALFIPNGTWLTEEMKDAPRTDSFKWGFTAIPKTTKDAYSSTFTEEMYIPKGAKNIDVAKEFLAFMYSDKAVELLYTNGGAIQPTAKANSLIPADDEKHLFYSVYDNGAKANTVGFVAHDAVEGVDLTSPEGILYGTVNAVVSGQKTADQWYNEVVEAVAKFN